MTRNRKIFAAVLAFGALAVAAGGSAFTASNDVPASVLGTGTNTVTGATVTALNYTLNGAKDTVLSVDFTVDPIPTFALAQVKVTKSVGNTGWLDCSVASATSITCDTTGSALLVADVTGTTLLVH